MGQERITPADVNIGFDHRDALITALGFNPADFPRKVNYHQLAEPVYVVIETIQDASGKFGRLLGTIHKDERNINKEMRDVIGGVELYDGRKWPSYCSYCAARKIIAFLTVYKY